MKRVYGAADISCSNLSEIADTNTRLVIAHLIGCYVAIEAADDPRKAGEKVRSTNAHESTPPGRRAAPGKVAHAQRLIAELAQSLENLHANTAALVVTREAAHIPVESVGGHKLLDVDETGRGFVAHTRKGEGGKFVAGVNPERMAAKMKGVVPDAP